LDELAFGDRLQPRACDEVMKLQWSCIGRLAEVPQTGRVLARVACCPCGRQIDGAKAGDAKARRVRPRNKPEGP